MTFRRSTRGAVWLVAASLFASPAVAAKPTPDCRILLSVTKPALLDTLRVSFVGTKSVVLSLSDGTKFSRHASSCDLDASDPLDFSCNWEFDDQADAKLFYHSLLALSRSCLGYTLADDPVAVDPNDGNDWNPVRKADDENGDYTIQLVEYGVRSIVTLDVYPLNLGGSPSERRP